MFLFLSLMVYSDKTPNLLDSSFTFCKSCHGPCVFCFVLIITVTINNYILFFTIYFNHVSKKEIISTEKQGPR